MGQIKNMNNNSKILYHRFRAKYLLVAIFVYKMDVTLGVLQIQEAYWTCNEYPRFPSVNQWYSYKYNI